MKTNKTTSGLHPARHAEQRAGQRTAGALLVVGRNAVLVKLVD